MLSRKRLISALISVGILIVLGVAQHFGLSPVDLMADVSRTQAISEIVDDSYGVQDDSDVGSGVDDRVDGETDVGGADVQEVDVMESDSSDADIETVETNATVVHVVDGDTLDAELDGTGKVRIRLLGVNTPETVDPRKTVECFGKDASDFSKRTLKEESRILLVLDPEADERDKYGRLLRNLVLADGTDFNALLVREGYAYAYTSFPLSPERKVELIRLQKEAKEAKRGLWGDLCEAE